MTHIQLLAAAVLAILAATALATDVDEVWVLPAADTPIDKESAPDWAKDHPDLLIDLTALRSAYPAQFRRVERRPKGIFLHPVDAEPILYDDGKAKTPEEAIENADVQDSLAQIYPLGPVARRIAPWFDPGRARSEPMLKALFGADKTSVAATAARIDFCGRRISFSGRQNAAGKLAEISEEIEAAIAKDPKLRPYVSSLGGTLNWRFIAGTKRLSSHAWGAAIDLNPDLGAYWKWKPESGLRSIAAPQAWMRGVSCRR